MFSKIRMFEWRERYHCMLRLFSFFQIYLYRCWINEKEYIRRQGLLKIWNLQYCSLFQKNENKVRFVTPDEVFTNICKTGWSNNSKAHCKVYRKRLHGQIKCFVQLGYKMGESFVQRIIGAGLEHKRKQSAVLSAKLCGKDGVLVIRQRSLGLLRTIHGDLVDIRWSSISYWLIEILSLKNQWKYWLQNVIMKSCRAKQC